MVTSARGRLVGTTTVQRSEYALEPLRQDDQFTLYRDRSAGPEARRILVLGPASTHPGPDTLRRIDHEYSLRNELDSEWAAQPLALSHYNGQQVLVLRDPGGEPLDRLVHGPIETRRFLRIAIGLATALKHLHQRQLIHKDIKPSNILVDPNGDQIWLTGFGIASRVLRERQPPTPPEFIAGTLSYMAPEQTGRMNRSIDSRSDLYSMGVVLYEMLTGTLPFPASDPMELVHAHIARQPVPPHERSKDVPGSVSGIVMKLLAKTAEERYQTAAGVERDLRRCLADFDQRRMDEFPLAQNDTPDRLLIPETLYGRTFEVETLLAAFDRVVAGGRPELVLVSGYSGVGKSSVVNELHKALVPPRGLFASGKFDQHKRDIPYATLVQALQRLVRPLLTKSDTELRRWREAFRDALDPNGQLIVDLVPELRLIIGDQRPVSDVAPKDAQARFHADRPEVHRRIRAAGTSSCPVLRRFAMAGCGDVGLDGGSADSARREALAADRRVPGQRSRPRSSPDEQARSDAPSRSDAAGHRACASHSRRRGTTYCAFCSL